MRVVDLGRGPERDVLHRGQSEAFSEAAKRVLLCGAKEHGEERRPLRALHSVDDLDRADPVAVQSLREGAEGREVGQVEAQACFVEKEEVAHDPNLGRTICRNDSVDQRVEFSQRLLHGLVLDGIELERAQCAEECREELPAQFLVVQTPFGHGLSPPGAERD